MIQQSRVVTIPAIMQVRHRAPAAAAAPAGNGLLNALIGYWPLNEAAGANNALDLHTNGLTLTQSNSPGATTGLVYATARLLAAASSQAFTSTSATLDLGDTDWTLAAWVNMTTRPAAAYIIKRGSSSSSPTDQYAMDFEGGSTNLLRVWMKSGATYYVRTAATHGLPATGAWLLVVGWHDSAANTLSIQINNGTIDTITTSGAAPASGAETFALGRYSTAGGFWNGLIGPAMIWKSAAGGGGVLSAAQRTALYNAGAGLAYASFTT